MIITKEEYLLLKEINDGRITFRNEEMENEHRRKHGYNFEALEKKSLAGGYVIAGSEIYITRAGEDAINDYEDRRLNDDKHAEIVRFQEENLKLQEENLKINRENVQINDEIKQISGKMFVLEKRNTALNEEKLMLENDVLRLTRKNYKLNRRQFVWAIISGIIFFLVGKYCS